ncbi:nose resistant to fluoxetine protein 6-like isoform X2 [Hermetia illucens]|uniref:nose resistant to fluoxetine protein 6-like isoform X2 n=1 Tax=Hermetia illucens TaxID=343691 RepID=UPI0018CC14FA|nr:nose resistant to fluoxetine protein 6-like isoform X2 [Hermetia illucens]
MEFASSAVCIFITIFACASFVKGSNKTLNLDAAIKLYKRRNEIHIDIDEISIESTLNISGCIKDFSDILLASMFNEIWAFKFLDSWGKLPSGILSDNYASFGHFDQCLSIDENIRGDLIRGQYCLAEIPVGNLVSLSRKSLLIGICIPCTCDVVEIQHELIDSLESLLDYEITSASVFRKELCTKKEDLLLSTTEIAAISIFASMGLLVILSTFYEYYTECVICRQNEFLTGFSLLTNGRKLFNTGKPLSSDTIECLYGIRCLAIIWILVIESYDIKMKQTQSIPKGYGKVLFRASFFIDTFFLLSGLLVTWSVFRELQKRASLNILRLFFHRYVRLFSIFAAAVLFCTTLFKYIGDGPLWNTEIEVFNPCRKFWWSTLGYVQNYVNPEEMHTIRGLWTLAFILIAALIVGEYSRYKWIDGISHTLGRDLMKILSRFFWSLWISWVIFACTKGYGGPVNKLLTLRVWKPLSRLCYAIYIIHMMVHIYTNGIIRTSPFIGGYDRSELFWGNFGTTICISIVSVLFLELPVTNAEKWMSGRVEICSQDNSYNMEEYSKRNVIGNGVISTLENV